MNLKAITERKLFRPAVGAALAIGCGVALWQMPLGERWINVSYDYLFRFGARPVTDKVVLVLMDNQAHKELGQERGHWNRALHTELLKKLTDGGCPLVVFDVWFKAEREPETDAALAEAMRRHGRVVLMAKATDSLHPLFDPVQVDPPHKLFWDAATNCGIAKTDASRGETARRHWPFPAQGEGEFLSLPWVAARLMGARLNEKPQHQWLRYYGEKDGWERFSYHYALSNAPSEFRDKIVFIGSKPEMPEAPDFPEDDKFRTPYTRWTGISVGGVEILATQFLNLVNGDWLRRPAWWVEGLVLITTGLIFGGALSQMRRGVACGVAAGAAPILTLTGVSLSYFTNFWFPWLIVVGGQLPSALAWAVLAARRPRVAVPPTTIRLSIPDLEAQVKASAASLPDAPDYELFQPPFGEGAYGKVWLVRNAIGQWQALKAVYLAKFGTNAAPYEREFNGIRRYKPLSDQHHGLLRVDFVSRKKRAGYFYYVMELGDSLAPGWEQAPWTYRPRDLARVRAQAEGQRLPVRECTRIGLVLSQALDFLHRQGLAHRDIKPQNVIFVNGQPKLADIGLVAEIRTPDKEGSWVGTPGFMPPAPEPPGTPAADIYGLGMVLYVIRTGRNPGHFPELSTTLVEQTEPEHFMRLNAVILKACQPDLAQRYASARELQTALLQVQKGLEREETASVSPASLPPQ